MKEMLFTRKGIRRALSLIFCMAMCFVFAPIVSNAASPIITDVAITGVQTPEFGKRCSASDFVYHVEPADSLEEIITIWLKATEAGEAGDIYFDNKSWKYLDSTDTFEAGTYRLLAKALNLSSYEFEKESGSNVINVEASINGEKVVAYENPDGCMFASKEFVVADGVHYNVWVNGKEFTEGNTNTEEGIACGAGKATLDITTTPYTLTLVDAEITKSSYGGQISAGGNSLKIVLVGANSLLRDGLSIYASRADLTITGTGSMTTTGVDMYFGAIKANNLVLENEGDIVIGSNLYMQNACIVCDTVTFAGSGNVTVNASSYGAVKTSGDVVFSGSGEVNLNAKGGMAIQFTNPETSRILLNGSNKKITLQTEDTAYAVTNGTIAGTNFDRYRLDGALDSNSVVFSPVVVSDGFEYEIVSGINGPEATLVGPKTLTGNVIVQDEIAFDGRMIPVTKIAEELFRANKNITGVFMGDNVMEIDPIAFAGCSNLQEVRFSDNLKVTSVRAGIFTQCTSLRKTNIPSSWDYIPRLFASRKTLEEVVIPASVKRIENQAFANCIGLKKIEFGGTEAQWKALIDEEHLGEDNDVLWRSDLVVVCTGVPLAITKQPVNATVTAGATATFKITATGEGLTYQWKYSQDNGKSWTNSTAAGAKTATLSTSAKASFNGRLYRCIVKDASGKTVTSEAAGLTVKPVLGITKQPVDVTVADGETAKFSVTATGEGLTYQWQYSKDGGKNWVNNTVSSAKKATLSLTAKESWSGRIYHCIVTDVNGKTVTSEAGSLTVKSTFGITKQPAALTVTVGESATFTVEAAGEGLTYQWQYSKDGSNWTNSTAASAKTASLSTTAKASFSGRQYHCIVTDATGKTVISEAATLTVNAAGTPAITAQPANTTVAVGETATFTVKATGEGLTYQWQYSKDGINWTNSTAASAKTASLSTTAKASFSGRQYHCIVSNANGQVISQAANLTVK